MRYATLSILLAVLICTLVQAADRAAGPAVHPQYRPGKEPKSDFNVGGKSFKIDPESPVTKRVRAMGPGEFDPAARRRQVEGFYRPLGPIHPDDHRFYANHDCGPFRREFINSAYDWPAAYRARWAWNNRVYFDDELWNGWMADQAFATQVAELQRLNETVQVGYLPPSAASMSPVLVYNDAYLDAVYNPVPFLAVLSLKSLKPDQATDWIGTAAAESLVSKLSSTPGLFVADRQQVVGAIQSQKLNESATTDTELASHVGKALDVEQVVAGSYVVDGDKVLINLRIVNVQTGAVQSGISKTVSRDQLLDEMPGLATSLTAALGFPTDTSSDQPAQATVKPVESPQQNSPPSENSNTGAVQLNVALNDETALKKIFTPSGNWTLEAEGLRLRGTSDLQSVQQFVGDFTLQVSLHHTGRSPAVIEMWGESFRCGGKMASDSLLLKREGDKLLLDNPGDKKQQQDVRIIKNELNGAPSTLKISMLGKDRSTVLITAMNIDGRTAALAGTQQK